MNGYHWEPNCCTVYAFYAADAEYKVTSVYYGVTENIQERMEDYKALFAAVIHNKKLAERKLLEATPSPVDKSKRPITSEWKKGLQFERHCRAVHKAMVASRIHVGARFIA